MTMEQTTIKSVQENLVSAGELVRDGIEDDVIGLIEFVRGKDYFDYNGNCADPE